MATLEPTKVEKRAIFFIGGYDPKSPEQFFERTDRENKRFETLWGAKVDHTSREQIGADITRTTFVASDDGDDPRWQCETQFNFLTLDDIVLKDFDRPFSNKLWRYLVTYWDYVLSGTAHSFITNAWRFSLYFFYPALMLTIAFAISLWIAGLVAISGIPFSWLAAALVFVAAFAAFVKLGGKRYHVLHLMDLWSFSRDFLRREQPQIETKLDRFASEINLAVRSKNFDEIILVGHSTGGALILDAAGRAYEKDSTAFKKADNLNVLTVGSTALKIGLHPAADWFRTKLGKLFATTNIRWVEYQCLTDVINFYKTDPAKLMRFRESMKHPPLLDDVRVNRMVSPETNKRIRKNFFRIHYQFVFGNTVKYHYDFPAICFGPASLIDRAECPVHFNLSLTGQAEPEQNTEMTTHND